MRTLGLDLSLTATGVACWSDADGVLELRTFKTTPDQYFDDAERMWDIKQNIMRTVLEFQPDAIGIEGPAFAKLEKRIYELAGVVKVALYEADHTFVTVQPNTLKKWATGNGRASKEDMVAAAREFAPDITDHNEADALHLARFVAQDDPLL